MRKKLLYIAFFLVAGGVHAADCSTVEEMDAADTEIASFKNWQNVKSFFENYKQCDSGSMAEGVSAAVVRLLAGEWSTTSQLSAFTSRNKAFESWIIGHIDTTTNGEYLELIRDNAKEKCAGGNKMLCEKIGNAANKALQELKEP